MEKTKHLPVPIVCLWLLTVLAKTTSQLQLKLAPQGKFFVQNKRKLNQMLFSTDYGRPERKEPSLHGRKFTPTPKFLGTAEGKFCLPHRPKFSDFFDFFLHWVSVVRGWKKMKATLLLPVLSGAHCGEKQKYIIVIWCNWYLFCFVCLFVFDWGGMKPRRSPNKGVRPNSFSC